MTERGLDIDVLVNNVGVGTTASSPSDLDAERTQLRLNVCSRSN